MKKSIVLPVFVFVLFIFSESVIAQSAAAKLTPSAADARLLLPPGFSATIVAEELGGARHMVVNKQGGLYIKLSRLKNGKGIVYLKDKNGDGNFDEQFAFGNFPGTGIYIRNNYLYASSNDDVYRYRLDSKGEVINPEQPEKIITGLVNRNRDNSKSIAVDEKENIYVNVGSYITACVLTPNGKKGAYPCPLLDSMGGIWQFKATKLNQHYSDGIRYATGFKNVVGLDWNSKTKSLFIMQHGRDQLGALYPEYISTSQANLLPAECMYEVKKGSNGGWPYIYYDHFQHKKILAPEYGGDGKKTGGENALEPAAAYPAHLAPNGLMFYTGKNFPAAYKDGAFIAFHGKSTEIDKGYLLAFQPFKNGKPSGKWQVFAENFSKENDPRRPCGLAQAADGSIYVSDDIKGTIYRIRYNK